jgi:hypothetical protein
VLDRTVVQGMVQPHYWQRLRRLDEKLHIAGDLGQFVEAGNPELRP